MFDQKWLKRYMLQNRPDGEAKDPAGPEPAGQRPPTRTPEPAAQALSVYEVTCPRCGNVYKSDSHFCRKCGHKRLEASVVVARPAAEASSRLPAPSPAPVPVQEPPMSEAGGRLPAPPLGRTYSSSEAPWANPPDRQRIPQAAAMSPSPMGFAQSRQFAPQDKQYGGARPSSPPRGVNYMPPSPQNALPRTMSMRSEARPASQAQAAYLSEARPASPGARPPSPGGQGAPTPWPMLGGGFYGPYGQFPYDANANMYNVWPTNHGSEGGAKNYVVLCKDDVEVRASPTYSDDARIGQLLHPGQVVVVDEKRMVSGSWFLHLADGRGWVFETKERLLVMTEVHDFERGLWHYSVVCEDDVETRISPTYSDDARTGIILGSGDTVAIDERCRVAGARFLKLADGRGWVFETRDRLLVFSEVRSKPQEARDFERGLWHYTVVCDDDVEIRAAPTYSDEARTGLMIHPGDCVAIDERCRVAAVWYLRLADGRGWVFESKDSRRVMMQLH